ncbi:MAG: hypothetical protein ACI9CF_001672 [Candidatus Omnitrophota bacterium]|jgi:uncharacterized protein (DUF1015 family)
MPEIKPFKAYRYNKAIVKNFNNVLTPPYDVISAEDQIKLYKKSPYNFVRIDLRKKTKAQDPYTGAQKQLKQWLKKGVFESESEESIYVYIQDYKNLDGKKAKRIGFLSLMKIKPTKVKKHEYTLSGPKKDRMKLLGAMGSQLSPIMGLFQDKPGKVNQVLKKSLKKKCAIDVTLSGVRHRIIVEKNPTNIAKICELMRDKNMYIADGHHRFEVTNSFRLANPQLKKAAYMMTYFCDGSNNDFTIYPTHRVLNDLGKGWTDKFVKCAMRDFVVNEFKSLAALEAAMSTAPKGKVNIGCYTGKAYLNLTTKKTTKDLDTTVLHKKFILPLLGEEVAVSKRIQFTRDAKEASTKVKQKKADIAFFLSKMPVSEMIRISDEGVKLPQKSTYFYPKLLSGIALYKFD